MEEELYDDLEDQMKENTTIEDESKCKVCLLLFCQVNINLSKSSNPPINPLPWKIHSKARIHLILT